MSSRSFSSFDLRKKITPKRARRSRSRSRTRTPSYSPPPPPSHPSRMKTKSKKKVEEAIARNSTHKAASEMRRPRSRSRSRTERAKSGTRDRREKKSKKKRRRSSDSSSDERNHQPRKERKSLQDLLKDYENVDKAMRKSASKDLGSPRSRSKRKSGSGESRRSREEEADRVHQQMMINRQRPLRVSIDPDQVVPSAQISPPAPPLISPSVARTNFKPKQVIADMVVSGHQKCKICNTYFKDTEGDAREHLKQHTDRVFLVSLPSDICFYTIEEAIIHLFTKVGIKKEDIEEKVF